METEGTTAFIESVLKDYLLGSDLAVSKDGIEPKEVIDWIKNEYTGLLVCMQRYIKECFFDKIWLNIALRDFAKLLLEPLLLHFNHRIETPF